MTVRYDPSTGPSGGPTRGAIALRDHWREVTGLGDLGIYNPRRVRGSSTTWSIHASGRAVDFAANANKADQKAKADDYCAFLIRHAVSFQLQMLIWDRRSWRSGRGWRNYQGVSPHTDHIHAELNIDGGQNLTLAKLRTQWARDHSTQEDDMTPELKDYLDRIELRLEALQQITGRTEAEVGGVVKSIKAHATTMRDSLANLIRNPSG